MNTDKKFAIGLVPNPNIITIYTWGSFTKNGYDKYHLNIMSDIEDLPENLRKLVTKIITVSDVLSVRYIERYSISIEKNHAIGYSSDGEQLEAMLETIINAIADFQGIADNETDRKYDFFVEGGYRDYPTFTQNNIISYFSKK